MSLLLLVLKNLKRNPLRTLLTTLAVVALVAVFGIITTILMGMDALVTEKASDVKLLITDRYRIPSIFDRRYMDELVQRGGPMNARLSRIPGFDPEKHTIWHWAIFSLDPELRDPNQSFFLIATLPEKIGTMTDDIEDVYDPSWVELMRDPPRSHRPNGGIVMGATRLAQLNKRVGDVFTARSITHREGTGTRPPIEMEFEIVAVIPEGNRWSGSGFMDYAYLDRVLKATGHEMDGKINIGWLQLADDKGAARVSQAVEEQYDEIKCETAATAFARFLKPLEGVLSWIKWILRPSILVVMTLILANTFSITMRERRTEVAVLKVLGFTSARVLMLVLGEAVLVGVLAGLVGAVTTYGIINLGLGGLPLPNSPPIRVSAHVLWWGPLIGLITALIGGVAPAVTAHRIRVADAFATET